MRWRSRSRQRSDLRSLAIMPASTLCGAWRALEKRLGQRSGSRSAGWPVSDTAVIHRAMSDRPRSVSSGYLNGSLHGTFEPSLKARQQPSASHSHNPYHLGSLAL